METYFVTVLLLYHTFKKPRSFIRANLLLATTWHLLSVRTNPFDSKCNASSSLSATKETEIVIKLSLNSVALLSAKELLALQTAQGLWIGFIKGNHCYCISSIQTKILQIVSLVSTLLILFSVHNNRKRFFLFLSSNKFLLEFFVFLS
jgi:hypothetical protein